MANDFIKQSANNLKGSLADYREKCFHVYSEVTSYASSKLHTSQGLKQVEQWLKDTRLPEHLANPRLMAASADFYLKLALLDRRADKSGYNRNVALFLSTAGATTADWEHRSYTHISSHLVQNKRIETSYPNLGVKQRNRSSGNPRGRNDATLTGAGRERSESRRRRSANEYMYKGVENGSSASLKSTRGYKTNAECRRGRQSSPSPSTSEGCHLTPSADESALSEDDKDEGSNPVIPLDEIARIFQPPTNGMRKSRSTETLDKRSSSSGNRKRKVGSKSSATSNREKAAETAENDHLAENILTLQIPANVNRIVLEKNGQRITVEI